MNDVQKERRRIGRSLSQIDAQLSGLSKRCPERTRLMKQKAILLRELDSVKNKLVSPASSEIITDHALVRWLERKHNINMQKLRDVIFTESLKSALESGQRYWSDGEVVFIIDYGQIQTVIPVSKFEEQAA